MPLRERERKLTYMGMLIATTQEKINKEVLFQVLHLLEYSDISMVIQDEVNDRDVYVWSGFFGHEYCHGDPLRGKI